MEEFKSFYKEVKGNEGQKCHYNARLDTYGCGCQHDCSYCYAKSLLSFRGLWDAKEPSVADMEKIRRKIRRLPKGKVIRLGGMTDCFAPIERSHRITYSTIKVLNAYGIPYLIVTKSPLVAEYSKILRKDLAHIQITVTCFDDERYKALNYEKAPLPSERIKAAEQLQAEGFDVALRLSPFIPEFFTSEDYEALNKSKVDKVIVEFLRVNTWVKKWFDIDFTPYTVKHGGYQHLPLETKIEAIKKITGKEVSVCEDEDRAYEYWKNNFNPNPKDCCNLRR